VEGGRTYTRTTASRGVSTTVLVLSGLFLGWFLVAAGGEVPWPTLLILGIFFVVSAFLTVSNYGDRIVVDEEGIQVRNPVFERLGWKPKGVAWDDIEGLREHRSKTLFIRPRKGRRIVLDSVAGYKDLAQEIQRRTGILIPRGKKKGDAGEQGRNL